MTLPSVLFVLLSCAADSPQCCTCNRCDGAGAVWDIFRREDSDRLAQWLTENAKDFMHAGRSVDTYVNAVEWVNPLHAHVSQGLLRLIGGLICSVGEK